MKSVKENSQSTREALRNYLTAALKLLEKQAQDNAIWTVFEDRVEFSDNSISTSFLPVTLYRSFVKKRKHLIESLPETERAKEALLSSGTVYSRPLSGTDGTVEPQNVHADRARELLNILVGSYLEHYETFEVREEVFSEHLQRFGSVWQSERVGHIVTVPLLSFDTIDEGIEIDDHISIAPLTPEVKTELWRPDALATPMISAWEMAQSKFAVIGRYTSASPLHGDYLAIMPSVERLVLAMRLLKAGDVSAVVAFDRLEYAYMATIASTTPQDRLRASASRRQTFSLLPEDVPKLLAIYSALGNQTIATALEVATSRFQQTYARDRSEDRIIDLTIALESTLLHDVRDELSFRLGLRGARLLTATHLPDQSFALLKALYETRSKIVHQGKTLQALAQKGYIATVGVDRFISDVVEWVRQAIQTYLRRLSTGETLASIALALDREVLENIGQQKGDKNPSAQSVL